jgi:uncharacterized membrane protein YidH (DUF202 family)
VEPVPVPSHFAAARRNVCAMSNIAAAVLGLAVAAGAFFWVRGRHAWSPGDKTPARTLFVMGAVLIVIGLVLLSLLNICC